MPSSKTELFGPRENDLAALSKALAHPARIAILLELADRSACVCGEIVKNVPLAQATISQHLKELKNARLIRGEVEGPRICYCLDAEGIRRIEEHLGAFLRTLHERAAVSSS